MTDPPRERARCAVLGQPVLHSLSPRLHEAALSAWGLEGDSRAVQVPPSRMADTLAALHAAGVIGVNVTAPLKRAAFEVARERTADAEAAGSANCLRREEGGYRATNTDGGGFVDFLHSIGIAAAGAGVVLIGGGGSAAGLAPALRAAGARVEAIARRPEAARAYAGLRVVAVHAWGSEAAHAAARAASLLVNTTPLGARPGEPPPLPIESLARGAVAVDLRYARPVPAWLEAASDRGLRVADGRGLLVMQAVRSLVFWFDRPPPLDRLRAVADWHPERFATNGI